MLVSAHRTRNADGQLSPYSFQFRVLPPYIFDTKITLEEHKAIFEEALAKNHVSLVDNFFYLNGLEAFCRKAFKALGNVNKEEEKKKEEEDDKLGAKVPKQK
jgi:hypothetical protein